MITILVRIGGCIEFDHVELVETASEVRITPIMRMLTPTGPGSGCDDVLNRGHYPVTLAAPLGGRRIVGACTPGDDSVEARLCRAITEAGPPRPPG